MACAQLDGVGRTREVEVVGFLGSVLQLLLQGVDVVEGELLQFVDLHADGLLVLGCHIADVLPLRLRYFRRSCSISSAFDAVRVLTSLRSASIFSNNIFIFLF